MRPDEHKKKKNTAYKKKHGIPTKGATSSGDGEQEKQHQGKKKGDFSKGKGRESHISTSAGARPDAGARKNPSSMLGDVRDDSETSSSGEEIVYGQPGKSRVNKAFKRREIVSNWQKYELEPEGEDTITSRGEDFQKLLESAGTALSSFRFKDELEWGEAGLDSEGDSSHPSSQQSSLLSIDPAQLAQSLSCLPVHSVLGIEADVFPADQLTANIKAAEEKKSSFLKDSNTKVPSDNNVSSSGCINMASDSSSDLLLETSAREPLKPSSSNLLSSTLSSNSQPSKSLATDSLKSRTLASPGLQSSNESGQKHVHQEKSKTGEESNVISAPVVSTKSFDKKPSRVEDDSIEDDLDFLLNLDTPTSVHKENTATATPGGGRKNHVQPASDTAPSTDKMSTKQSQKGKENTIKATPVENEDLEDWLDSVLDS